MGKIGRIACIALPGVLTVASLICLAIVFLAGLNKNDPNLRSLYFLTADTTTLKNNLTAAESLLDKATVNSQILDALKQQVQDKNIYDYYDIYLWNYCAGNGADNATTSTPTYCSPRTASFWFNPLAVWGLNTTDVAPHIPKALSDGLSAYEKASKWLFIAYTVAFWATVASFGTGFLAIFSRWGSLLTTLASSVATLFSIVAAAISTALFSAAAGAIDSALKGYGIHVAVGSRMFALDWLAAAFSLAASVFWLASVCCCSGRSSHPYSRDAYAERGRRRRGLDADKNAAYAASPFGGNRGYQPLEGQQQRGVVGAQHQRGLEMDTFGSGQSPYQGRETAYEPFRHERV